MFRLDTSAVGAELVALVVAVGVANVGLYVTVKVCMPVE